MRISELYEATVETDDGDKIIRAQNYEHVKVNIKKSGWRELRGLVFPNEMWFTDSYVLIHRQIGEHLVLHTSITEHDKENIAIGVILRISKLGKVYADGSDYNWRLFPQLKQYPILKRLKIKIGGTAYKDHL